MEYEVEELVNVFPAITASLVELLIRMSDAYSSYKEVLLEKVEFEILSSA